MLCWWYQNLFGVCFFILFFCFCIFFEGLFFLCVVFVCLVYFFAVSLVVVVFACAVFGFFLCFFGGFRDVSVACCFFYIVFICFRAFFLLFLWRVVFVCFFLVLLCVSLGAVVYLSFQGGLWLLFLRGSLRVVLALLFVNYVAGFLAFCRIYI